MAVFRPPRHIVWSTDRIDLADPFQRRWYLRQVLMHGRAEDIAQLDLAEIEQELEALQLPEHIDRLWRCYLAQRDGGILMESLDQILKAKRQEILALAQQRGARNVRVFGSVARGEARADSDIDFLVDLEPGRSLLALGGLLMDLRALLGREVDLVTEAGLRARLRPGILAEARPL